MLAGTGAGTDNAKTDVSHLLPSPKESFGHSETCEAGEESLSTLFYAAITLMDDVAVSPDEQSEGDSYE
ncbi:hypothetical protein [Niabella hibiscisoli]|uniref:hypothetical protein n=1 Tax=Niabella hibiscisoli TaxID=1825928 RepID=UPI001F0E5C08|nr:hypothetical protein [Niabella hibiscisoli]MCH5715587.1 hypothetical protein [Niabella hibiscisoli]